MTPATVLALGVLSLDLRRVRSLVAGLSHRPARRSPHDATLLAELTALGLSGGLGFTGAVSAAARHVPPETARIVGRALRKPGSVPSDPFVGPLFANAHRASHTGAPLLSAIEGYAASLRLEERSAAVERARRLPVKLLFPLALLILPGFLLLTVGPAVLAGIDRLGL